MNTESDSERRYAHIENEFKKYLVTTRNTFIHVVGVRNNDPNDFVSQRIPFVHRWSQTYRNRVMAKLYRLNDWYQWHPSLVTMVTFTTKHNMSHEDQLILLKECENKIMKIIRIDKPGVDYISVYEHHKSGYAHIHSAIFCHFTPAQMSHYKEVWSKLYDAGSVKHGVNFSVRNVGVVRNVMNYLMKYLSKSLQCSDMSSGQLRFNAVVWNMTRSNRFPGIKLYTCSRNIAQIMKLPKDNTFKGVRWLVSGMRSTCGEITKIKILNFDYWHQDIFDSVKSNLSDAGFSKTQLQKTFCDYY